MTAVPEQRERVSSLMRHLRALGAGAELGCTVKQATRRETETGTVETSEKSSEKILTLLQATSGMTTKELAEHLGIGPRAVEKQIEKLMREGRLQRIGAVNGGHWHVQKATN
jgi:predicted HTH transcriptional regulator